MDIIATILGLAAGAIVVLTAAGGELGRLGDGGVLLMVVVGGIAATMVAFPLSAVANVLSVARKVFSRRSREPAALVARVVGLAETARRRGILALEKELGGADDPFLAAGVRLAVDGTEPKLIVDIMETELKSVQARHARGQRLMRTLGRNWALLGGIGALLVLVLQAGGAGGEVVGRAALPLLYGALLAGFVGLPFARKLAEYSEREVLAKRMMIEGIMAIQTGHNPRLIEHKLMVFLQPRDRRQPPSGDGRKEAAPQPVPQPAEDRGAEELAAWLATEQNRILQLMREAAEYLPAGAEQKAAISAMIGKVERGEMALVRALAALDRGTQHEVFQALAGPPPRPVELVRVPESGFGFEDIALLTDREIQTLLREVDQKDLVVALKGASPGLREKLLGNMSERVRGFILEEMSFLGQMRPREVLEVQMRIVAQVLQLWAQGQISLP